MFYLGLESRLELIVLTWVRIKARKTLGSAAVDSKSNVYFGNAAGVLFALQPPGRQCPGGSLQQCMSLCPGDPAAAYQACVRDCAARCGHPIYV